LLYIPPWAKSKPVRSLIVWGVSLPLPLTVTVLNIMTTMESYEGRGSYFFFVPQLMIGTWGCQGNIFSLPQQDMFVAAVYESSGPDMTIVNLRDGRVKLAGSFVPGALTALIPHFEAIFGTIRGEEGDLTPLVPRSTCELRELVLALIVARKFNAPERSATREATADAVREANNTHQGEEGEPDISRQRLCGAPSQSSTSAAAVEAAAEGGAARRQVTPAESASVEAAALKLAQLRVIIFFCYTQFIFEQQFFLGEV
jgi:hypothetical protein